MLSAILVRIARFLALQIAHCMAFVSTVFVNALSGGPGQTVPRWCQLLPLRASTVALAAVYVMVECVSVYKDTLGKTALL